MRTNIEIDDKLMKKVMRDREYPSKRAAVEAGLRSLLRLKAQTEVLKMRGRIKWEGDLEQSRLGRFAD
jgi:Arc/MetJ family transcription regulator